MNKTFFLKNIFYFLYYVPFDKGLCIVIVEVEILKIYFIFVNNFRGIDSLNKNNK